MKSAIRSLFHHLIVIYLVVRFYPGIRFDGTLKTLLITAFVLTVLTHFVKPLIKLFLLPINILTLNLFGWVANVITLFLATILVSGFDVKPFFFPGINYAGFVVPSTGVSLLFSLVFASLYVSTISAFLKWLYE
jgi:putative membrane protein